MATRNKKGGTAANGRKTRQSPSAERQIALALVRVIECVEEVEKYRGDLEKLSTGEPNPDFEQACLDRKKSIYEARRILEANNYAGLESIESRVAALEAQLAAAISMRDGKAGARLFAELDRAKAGRPPISPPKKPKAAKASNQQKLPAVDNGAAEQTKAPGATEQASGTASNG